MMYVYLTLTMALTLGLCVVAYRFFDKKIRGLGLSLDDGRGYFLISVILITFVCSSIAYFLGIWLGFDANVGLQGRLVAAVLLNAVVALLCLTYGLVRFREGERY